MTVDGYIGMIGFVLQGVSCVKFCYVIDSAIKHFSRCKRKEYVDVYNCLKRVRESIRKMEINAFGDEKPGRLYEFGDLDDFYDACCQMTSRKECYKIYNEIETELWNIFSVYLPDNLNQGCDLSELSIWYEKLPEEVRIEECRIACQV